MSSASVNDPTVRTGPTSLLGVARRLVGGVIVAPVGTEPERGRTSAVVTAILATALAITIALSVARATRFGVDSWSITEWLINYQGGFVRRGLGGAVLSWLSSATAVAPNILAIGASVVAYLALLGWFLRATRGLLPVAVVLSSVLAGGFVFGEYLIRKDALLVLLFVAATTIFRRSWPGGLGTVLINLLVCIGVLLHEAAFFMAFPALVATACARDMSAGRSFLAAASSAAVRFAPVLITFLIVFRFSGDDAIARAINASLQDVWRGVDPTGCCFAEPAAAIDSLRWTAAHGVSLTLEELTTFSLGLWVPLAWLGTIAVFWWVLATSARAAPTGAPVPAHPAADLTAVMALQLCAIFPLFVVGVDFGRWITLWTCSSVALWTTGLARGLPLFGPLGRAIVRSGSAVLAWRPAPLLFLLVGLPGCCWTVARWLAATPVGATLKAAIKVAF
ncbi:hypothetical protein [Rhodoplanes azumiensis]|uniref:Glycosyltransferase RgtA/B/C/D-like domain-containing protein n=1 Tax=Rhodoplanes azumiensis TaxID=1897628 RepID=A0ABW5AIZ8_9BRAD